MSRDNRVYKFYNKNNELLYIGITNNIIIRIYQHKKDKEWFPDVVSIQVSDKISRNEAHIYEVYYISKDKPKYNLDFSMGGEVGFALPELNFSEYDRRTHGEVRVYKKKKEKTKEEIDALSLYLEGMLGQVMLNVEDRVESIEKINIRDYNNNRLLKNVNTLNAKLDEIGVNYRIVEFTTSKMIDGKKKNYKNAWRVEKFNYNKEKIDLYLKDIVGTKLFYNEQEKLTEFIVKSTSIGININYRTKKIQYNTLEKILRDDLGLEYGISKSIRETSNKDGNKGKRYIIINKL